MSKLLKPNPQTQHQFTVSIIVKGATREKAQAAMAQYLNEWFLRGRPIVGSLEASEGDLLLWTILTAEDLTVYDVVRTGDPADATGDEFEPS